MKIEMNLGKYENVPNAWLKDSYNGFKTAQQNQLQASS